MFSVSMTQMLKLIILPPSLNLLIILFAVLFIIFRRKWIGSILFLSGFVSLYLAATPVIANRLIAPLESIYPPLVLGEAQLRGVDAIVVLAGGRNKNSVEYGGETVSEITLARIRFAAKLAKYTGLPLLVSGGAPNGELVSEAELMAEVFKEDYGLSVRWVEKISRNTFENAELSSAILRQHNIERIFCVTNAWHMPRSMWSFYQNNVKAIPAPTGYLSGSEQTGKLEKWLPKASALRISAWALHEYLGMLWYRMQYQK